MVELVKDCSEKNSVKINQQMANRFIALVYLNGSSTTSVGGIEYESELTVNVSFPWNVKLRHMQRRILRSIVATHEQRILSMSYWWNIASNVVGHRFRSIHLITMTMLQKWWLRYS